MTLIEEVLEDVGSVHCLPDNAVAGCSQYSQCSPGPGLVLFRHLFLNITFSDHTYDVFLAKVTIKSFSSFVVFT